MREDGGSDIDKGSVNDANVKNRYSYSLAYRLADNSPYIATGLVGALICYQVHWLLAVLELLASFLGPLWIIVRTCPTCLLYGNPACSSGYGLISAKLVKQGDPEMFAHVFTTQITAVIPMWFMPVGAGAYLFATGEGSLELGLLMIVFSIVAFVVVPLKARYITCAKCPRRSTCPWGSRTAIRLKGWNNFNNRKGNAD
ncbi:MAG: hypothetical protein JSW25_07360 [Thermoplasmata archaeon]|nr:MAG: hypothetical protein JSW25_07360 [Thermoplasmata archaeon]